MKRSGCEKLNILFSAHWRRYVRNDIITRPSAHQFTYIQTRRWRMPALYSFIRLSLYAVYYVCHAVFAIIRRRRLWMKRDRPMNFTAGCVIVSSLLVCLSIIMNGDGDTPRFTCEVRTSAVCTLPVCECCERAVLSVLKPKGVFFPFFLQIWWRYRL